MPISESLVEELSQALLRMDMGLEQEYAYDIFSSMVVSVVAGGGGGCWPLHV